MPISQDLTRLVKIRPDQKAVGGKNNKQLEMINQFASFIEIKTKAKDK